MKPRVFLDIDPRTLRLPTSRVAGADPVKFASQVGQFGNSTNSMSVLEVTRGANGELMIKSGVTRAARVAKLLPGQTVRVEVIDDRPSWDLTRLPRIGDLMP